MKNKSLYLDNQRSFSLKTFLCYKEKHMLNTSLQAMTRRHAGGSWLIFLTGHKPPSFFCYFGTLLCSACPD